MCVVVFQVNDKAAPENPKRVVKYSRGCVIEVLPDGWQFSERERTHPDWRIVMFPGLPIEAFHDLREPELDKDGALIGRRANAIDLDSIPQFTSQLKSGEVVELKGSDAAEMFGARKPLSNKALVIG